MKKPPEELSGITVKLKANVYFDGRVVSHTLTSADGARCTVGLIYPGEFTFNTDAAERMDILAGTCRVRLALAEEWTRYEAGAGFDVPAKSRFDIAVDAGITEYLCTFG